MWVVGRARLDLDVYMHRHLSLFAFTYAWKNGFMVHERRVKFNNAKVKLPGCVESLICGGIENLI